MLRSQIKDNGALRVELVQGWGDMFSHSVTHRKSKPLKLDYLRMHTVAPKTKRIIDRPQTSLCGSGSDQ